MTTLPTEVEHALAALPERHAAALRRVLMTMHTKPKRPRGRPPKYTEAEIVDALRKSRGFIRSAGRYLGCHASTVTRYVLRYSLMNRNADIGAEDTGCPIVNITTDKEI